MKYRRKTPIVEAIQWMVNNFSTITEFTNNNVAITADMECLIINGEKVSPGSWIIKITGGEAGNIVKLGIVADDQFQTEFEVVPE